MLLHGVFAPLAAGEGTRGYLHGGLVIDFVGQASPVAKWRLLGMDSVLFVLQLLILGAALEKRRTHVEKSDTGGDLHAFSHRRQDHDSEERGVLRQSPSNIELQNLQCNASKPTDVYENKDPEGLSLLESGHRQADQHPLDSFYSGEHIIANLQVVEIIRTCWYSRLSGSEFHASDSDVQTATAAVASRTLNFGLGASAQGD